MINAFEKILEMLEEKLRKSEERYHRYLDDSNLSCMFDRSDIEEKRVDTIKEMLEIVQEVAEEYKNGHFGCNFNGEHEKCKDCCLTDCKNRNTIWFGLDVTDTNVGNNGWIPCSEMLPEDGVPVLLQDFGGYYSLGVSETKRNIKGFRDDDWWGSANNYKAWQPLPEPYEEKE